MSIFTPVFVTAVRFTSSFEIIPSRIELDGISYRLDNDCTTVPTPKGEETKRIVDVSDGIHQFRLCQDAQEWRLLSMSSTNA